MNKEELRERARIKLSQGELLGLLPAQAILDYDQAKEVLGKLQDAVIDRCFSLLSKEEEAIRARITAPIVCLCGSTRFTADMLVKQWELTKQGYIVVSWCALPDDYFNGEDKTHIGDQEGVKELVDEIHKRKIDLCDEVFVLNIDGYIGESTASEIAYAEKIGRPVKYQIALKESNGE